MTSHTAFFYGTLIAPSVLHRVIYGSATPDPWQPSLTTVRPALLPSYQRHRVRHCDYPAIIPNPNSEVRGTVVTGLTDGDVWRLDVFEGEQYVRRKVVVRILEAEVAKGMEEGRGEEVEAESYVWKEGMEGLEAGEWDFEVFKRERMGVWSGEVPGEGEGEEDEGFGDVERAVREAEEEREGERERVGGKDPMGGRGVNGKIGRKLEQVENGHAR